MDSKSLRTAEWADLHTITMAEATSASQVVPTEADQATVVEAELSVASNKQIPVQEPTTAEYHPSRFSGFKQTISEKTTQAKEFLISKRRKAAGVALSGLILSGSVAGYDAMAGASTHSRVAADSKETNYNAQHNAILTSTTPAGFVDGAFLPKGASNTSKQVSDRVESWSSEKGPLAGPETNRASLALQYSAIAEPAKSPTIDNSYDYQTAFEQAYNQLSGPNAKSKANSDAQAVAGVMGATESYQPNFPGSQFTQLKAVYGKNGDIVDVKLAHVTNPNLGGVEFSVPKGADLTKISPVFVDSSGKEYVAGFLPLPQKGAKTTSNNGSTGNKTTVNGGIKPAEANAPTGQNVTTTIEAPTIGTVASTGSVGTQGPGAQPSTPNTGPVGTGPGGSPTGPETPPQPPVVPPVTPPETPPQPPVVPPVTPPVTPPSPPVTPPIKTGDTNVGVTDPGAGNSDPFNAGGSSDANSLAE